MLVKHSEWIDVFHDKGRNEDDFIKKRNIALIL